jgi:hypothetical protein
MEVALSKGARKQIKDSAIIREPFRRFLTKRFPFGIIYRIEKERIFIVTVMHLKQEPFFWLKEIQFFDE